MKKRTKNLDHEVMIQKTVKREWQKEAEKLQDELTALKIALHRENICWNNKEGDGFAIGWYFIDETENWNGPFDTVSKALAMLASYCEANGLNHRKDNLPKYFVLNDDKLCGVFYNNIDKAKEVASASIQDDRDAKFVVVRAITSIKCVTTVEWTNE
jgi:hypothetical protein